eukprot:7714-Amorphochlora_amoeboformis.AAC.1
MHYCVLEKHELHLVGARAVVLGQLVVEGLGQGLGALDWAVRLVVCLIVTKERAVKCFRGPFLSEVYLKTHNALSIEPLTIYFVH